MGIKLIKKNNEGFTPDAIKRFTVDDPNYVDHIIIPDKKNGDDVIVKIVRGTKEHPWFSGTIYYGWALRSSATEPFSTGIGSPKLMADWLDNLAKQDPEESLADLDAMEQRAKSEQREGAQSGRLLTEAFSSEDSSESTFLVDCGTHDRAGDLRFDFYQSSYGDYATILVNGKYLMLSMSRKARAFDGAVDWCRDWLKKH